MGKDIYRQISGPNYLPYTTAREDLANIIAQETSGFIGAFPEDEDYDLAEKFIEEINS